jgi:hypothetical protein
MVMNRYTRDGGDGVWVFLWTPDDLFTLNRGSANVRAGQYVI